MLRGVTPAGTESILLEVAPLLVTITANAFPSVTGIRLIRLNLAFFICGV